MRGCSCGWRPAEGTMVHRENIERYPGSLRELAEEIGNLRYDALAEFLHQLAAKLEADAAGDQRRGRPKLAVALGASAEGVAAAAAHIEQAWRICEPHM